MHDAADANPLKTAADLRGRAVRIRRLMAEKDREEDYLPLRSLIESLEKRAAELERIGARPDSPLRSSQDVSSYHDSSQKEPCAGITVPQSWSLTHQFIHEHVSPEIRSDKRGALPRHLSALPATVTLSASSMWPTGLAKLMRGARQ